MKWLPLGVAATGVLAALTTATTGMASAAPVSPQASGAGARAAAAPQVPRLSWAPCDHGFQCATARVPLDYQHPDGATVRIAVIRHLATGPRHPAPTLFLNGGGPNEQITTFVASYPHLPAVLRARFNLATFDQRGFGRSSTVQCFPNAAAENKFLAGLPPGFPVGARQDAVWVKILGRFDAVCAQHGGPLVRHASSTSDARDMDLIRQAIGARTLNYFGSSYGTGMGAIYANLFPATVGRMVLDGNLNPVTWSEGGKLPDALREGADLATASVMRSFLNLCGKAPTSACAFSAGTPAATRAKYAALLRRLLKHPVTIGTPPQTFAYANIINDVPLGLLAATSEWPTAAGLLQQVWAASGAGHARVTDGAAARAVTHADAALDSKYAGQEQVLAQQCADVADTHSIPAWYAAARLAKARSGGIGTGYTWEEESCAAWPAAATHGRYTGPWNRRTAGPILVVGNTGDPVTPYHDSVSMAHDLANARLLTVNELGHTVLDNPDTCATNYLVSYLTTGALPPAGTVCQASTQPFATP